MTEEKRTTLHDLLGYVKENIKEAYECDSGADPYEMAHEVADGLVPVYTYDLLMMAADDLMLATVEPENGPAFDGSPTPVNIIAANIYDRLYEEAWEELQLWQERTGRSDHE